jgi:hypothetical protein
VIKAPLNIFMSDWKSLASYWNVHNAVRTLRIKIILDAACGNIYLHRESNLRMLLRATKIGCLLLCFDGFLGTFTKYWVNYKMKGYRGTEANLLITCGSHRTFELYTSRFQSCYSMVMMTYDQGKREQTSRHQF